MLPIYGLLFLIFCAIISPSIQLTISLFRIVFTSDLAPDALHVPTFYCPRTKKVSILHLVVMMIGGIIFACLHHFGPRLTVFQVADDKRDWSFLSYCMMIGLLVGVIIAYLLSKLQNSGWTRNRTRRQLLRLLMCLELYALYVGIFGRLYLILLAIILLRRQRDSAFCAVEWTNFIPHIM